MPECHTVDERLCSLLEAIPATTLTRLLGRQRFASLHRLVSPDPSDEFSDSSIPRYAVALEGSRLLQNTGLLAALLQQVHPSVLNALAKRYIPSPFDRDADNALYLAGRTLRPGSVFTEDVLEALDLGTEAVPTVEKRQSLETIDPFTPLPALLDYQDDVRNESNRLIEAGAREFLVQMPTGAGKTRTAMEIVVDQVETKGIFSSGRSVVWLAHTEELCEQAVEAFTSVWSTRGNMRARVARLWGSYAPPEDSLAGTFVVAGTARVHALVQRADRAFQTLSNQSSIVVIDEAHRALAPTVVGQLAHLRRASGAILIGLSATPGRSQESVAANRALSSVFGKNLVTPNLGNDPIGELRRRGILSSVDRVVLTYSDTVAEFDRRIQGETTEDVPEHILNLLAANPLRNLAILEELQKRVSHLAPAIVFCCSVDHSELLGAALRMRGIQAAAIDCRMNPGRRRSVIDDFAKGRCEVLLNFGVLSTGFDAPNVSTVVIARPTRSAVLYSQMLGRGLRGPKMGGTQVCTVVDVRDHLARFGELSELYKAFEPYWVSHHESHYELSDN